MKPFQPSRTAEHMALFRAFESVRPPNSRLFFDPYAARLLRPGLRKWVWLSRWPVLAKLNIELPALEKPVME